MFLKRVLEAWYLLKQVSHQNQLATFCPQDGALIDLSARRYRP